MGSKAERRCGGQCPRRSSFYSVQRVRLRGVATQTAVWTACSIFFVGAVFTNARKDPISCSFVSSCVFATANDWLPRGLLYFGFCASSFYPSTLDSVGSSVPK